jgi:predicted RNA-binding protein with PUA-like domain
VNYWLIKSEADCYSIDDLKRDGKTPWAGVRNFQARNFMRDVMKVGDMALFYHSSSSETGVYGVARVSSKPYPDPSAFDPKDEHYDGKQDAKRKDALSSGEVFEPAWMLVDFSFVKKFDAPVTLAEIKNDPRLEGMPVRQKGSRLSIQPVSEKHFQYVLSLRK